MTESFKEGDLVEVIRANRFTSNAAPEVVIGLRGTVVKPTVFDNPEYVEVDYGLEYNVCSNRDSIRKIEPPPQREQTSTWDDLIVWRPKETANV